MQLTGMTVPSGDGTKHTGEKETAITPVKKK